MRPIEIRESRGLRTLHFGNDGVQGAMRVARPWALELAYTREMLAALLLCPTWPQLPRRILQIGLGAGSLARFIYRQLPVAEQTIIERDARVLVAARQHFSLPAEDDRLCIDIADGLDWLRQATTTIDLILVDAYDADGAAGALQSLGFYQSCRQHLAAGGLLACNLLSACPQFLQTCCAFDAAFAGHSRLLPITPGGNVIALGAEAETVALDATALRERAAQLNSMIRLDLTPLVERLVMQENALPLGL